MHPVNSWPQNSNSGPAYTMPFSSNPLKSSSRKHHNNSSSSSSSPHPSPVQPSHPVYASFPSSNLTIGCGVAIFHLASSRVVVCYHTRDKYWFLPKGRRDSGEESGRAAEREGFEEVSRAPCYHHSFIPRFGFDLLKSRAIETVFFPSPYGTVNQGPITQQVSQSVRSL